MRRNSSRRALVLMAIALLFCSLLVAVIAFKPVPIAIWNVSNSVPLGFYFVRQRQPQIGEIAVVRPPDWVRLFASSRGYLPDDVWLLKPVYAVSGAVVCRFGIYVFVHGKLVARAKKHDRQQRFLPVWSGCRILKAHAVFLLAKPKNSFDSRYFGPVSRYDIAGTAVRFCLSCLLNVHVI